MDGEQSSFNARAESSAPLAHLSLRFNQRMTKINSFLGGGKIEERGTSHMGTRRLNQGCVESSLSSSRALSVFLKTKANQTLFLESEEHGCIWAVRL